MERANPIVFPYPSLELRRAEYDTVESPEDFEQTAQTEVAYLFAHGVRLARLHYDDNGAPEVGGAKLHVLFELGDHLGSSSKVLDKATSELVEASSYMGYGQADSDYRPARWKSFREDYRFTGKEEDSEVGLTYFGKRFLSSALGRWASADPLAVHGMGADLNVHGYVSGSVLRACLMCARTSLGEEEVM